MKTPDLEALLKRMRSDWDRRARENARYYVNTAEADWSEEEFFRTGRETVIEQILSDRENICQGRKPSRMRVLEIGCGAGRVTRALGEIFGEVHALDVSGEMVALARRAVARQSHVHIYRNNGFDLAVVPPLPFDFAFSTIVFQHIPSRAVIANYTREVWRLLRPGSLFKFQVQGETAKFGVQETGEPDVQLGDTWLGYPFSDEDALALARECGFEARSRHGAGEPDFWLWFFKVGVPVAHR